MQVGSSVTRVITTVLLLCGCLLVIGRPAEAAENRIAITGVKVFPSPAAEPISDAVILIEGDRIVRVGPRRAIRIPAGYRVLDHKGGSALAGFWNSHVHLTRPAFLKISQTADADLQRELENDFTRWGFTTVFDLASTTEVASQLKDRIAEGRVRGPRVLSVAEPFYPPDATPVYARPLYEAYQLPSAEIGSPAAAAGRVQRQVRSGADGVKLFTGSILGGAAEVAYMRPEAVRAISRAAERLNKPVFAHPTDKDGLEVAVLNGVDVLAHAAPLMGSWSPKYARWIAQRKVALIPTLALFKEAANPSTPVETALQQTKALAGAGGLVLFGTDAGFTDAFDPSAEMQLMQSALGWQGLLASLTTTPAEVFGENRFRGSIAPSMAADLVILGGDPSRDVRAMTDVRTVIRAGRVVYPVADPHRPLESAR